MKAAGPGAPAGGKAGKAARNISPRSFAVFLLVGGLATALHYTLALLGVFALGMAVVPASALGFASSAVANYLLNARLTFRSKAAHRTTAPRFLAVCSAGLLMNSLFLSLLLSLGMHAVPSQILTTLGVLIWNYVVNGLWTFKKKPRPGSCRS